MSKEELMKRTIEIAINTIKDGNPPFGAIVVRDSIIISEGVNEMISLGDPTSHAELNAIKKATKLLKRSDLSDCELYASGEPCLMCLSLIYFVKIKRVYVAYPKEETNIYGLGNQYARNQILLPEEKRDIKFIKLKPKGIGHPYKVWEAKT